MSERESELQQRVRKSAERLEIAESASGIGIFTYDPHTGEFNWSEHTAVLLGVDSKRSFIAWERSIFIDDVPKIHEAFRNAVDSGHFYVEFRLRRPDGSLHWIAGKGQAVEDAPGRANQRIRGAFFEITERKALEARLLAVNETL